MKSRIAILAGLALAVAGCTTVPSAATNPLQARWNGKTAGSFFAAYGPPLSDIESPGGATLYKWRGGFSKGRACQVELTVDGSYKIRTIRAVVDQPGQKGGPSHCEKTLDAAG
jgi:hypothetical protein